jgi:drug/metabolite transporter (DMT)-like permease
VKDNGDIEPAGDRSMPKAKRQERIPLAIAYMVGATATFACSSAISKWLVDTYPVGEVLWSRNFVGLITCAIIILPFTGLSVFYTNRPRAHMIRAGSQTCSQTLLLIAFSMMPLASATAINFAAPLFATLASAYFLKESVGRDRWIVLAVGFLGVILVTKPGAADTFTMGALFALGNAVLFGTVTAGVRGMTATESAETLTLTQLVLISSIYATTLPFAFVMPNGFDALLMVGNGVFNGVAQYWWTRAIHLAPTSAVVPFHYLSLVWTILLGFAIWGDVPTWNLLLGSAIVVASGLFLLWRESRKPAPPTEVAP